MLPDRLSISIAGEQEYSKKSFIALNKLQTAVFFAILMLLVLDARKG